jgi:4-hydroxybenzoate polyprenyltransferase
MFVYFTFPANILIYGINDIYDKDTDALNEKKNGYENALTNTKEEDKKLKKVIVWSNIFFIIYALFSFTFIPVLFIFVFILFAHQYSATPLRAKAVPFLDSIVSGILYILPVFVSWGIIYNTLPPIVPIIAGIIWSISMHAYSAIPDINADSKAGIQTGATILGKNKMLILCGILYTTSAILAVPYLGIFAYIGGLVYLVLIILSIKKQTPEETLKYYKMFPVINTLIGAVIFFSILFKNLNF